MSLSRDQLGKWSERGDPIHAWYSYQMVKESFTRARLQGMTCAVYPQGSYANKTNIVSDSDIDMVITLTSAFYPDTARLSKPELAEYQRYYERARQTWRDFREVVLRALRPDFFLHEGSKCIQVRSGIIRLPADVLIALDHRYYRSFPSFEQQQYAEGVQFYGPLGRKIVNYPKRHIRACAQKNDRTLGRYRPVVRIAKNARNALIGDEAVPVKAGTAPSYFLESLLWNVPDSCYGGDRGQAYHRAITWLHEHTGEIGGFGFPAGMGKIFGSNPDTSWSQPHARAIIGALHHQLTG